MNNTIDFHNLSELSKQLMNNTELFNRTGTIKKSLRSNPKLLSSLQFKSKAVSTSRPTSNLDKSQQSPRKAHSPLLTPFELSLPKLSRQTRRPRTKIDRSYLQQWLDSVLQDEDSGVGPLRGVRKYHVDKRQLLGQNLSLEDIDKLYHSLYIYSFGMRRLLSELLHGNEEMILRFWRVFLKLVEKSSEFQNLFSVIQRKHNDTVDNLKKLVMKKEEQLQEQKRNYQDKMKGIIIDIDNKTRQVQELTVEKTSLQTNFQLTDEAFTEEVGLRLRFEEKINSVNTAYSELKLKYYRMLEQLKVLKENQAGFGSKERQYIEEKCIYEAALLQQQQMTQSQKQKSKIKDQEIAILKEQVFNFQQQRLDIFKKQNEQEIELKSALLRQKKANLKLAEQIDKTQSFQSVLEEKTSQVNQLIKNLSKERKSLEEAYIDIYQIRQQLIKVNKQVEDEKNNVMLLQRRLDAAEQISKQATQSYKIIKEQYEGTVNQIQFLKKRITMLNETLQSNQQTIEFLRQAKDKFDKKYKIIETEQKSTLQALSEANSKIFALEEEKKGYQLSLEKKQKFGNQIENKAKIQLDSQKEKSEALASQINQKNTNFLQLSERLNKVSKEVGDKNLLIEEMKKSSFELQNRLSRQIFQKKNLEGKSKLLQESFQNVKKQVERLNQMLIELRKSNMLLSDEKTTLNFILNEKKKFTDSEYEVVKRLINNYKQQLEEKANYIHPMHYWDKEGCTNRAELRFLQSKSMILNLNQVIQAKEKTQLETIQQVITTKKQLSSVLNKVQNLERDLGQNNKKLLIQIEQSKIKSQKLKKQNEDIHTQEINLKQTKQSLENLISKINQIKKTKEKMKSIDIQASFLVNQNYTQTENMIESQPSNKTAQNQTNNLIFEVSQHQQFKSFPDQTKEMDRQRLSQQKQRQLIPEDNFQYQPINQEIPQISKQIPKPKATFNTKPVTNKQFSKALKLTFMRR